jgi:hypothetical protein
MDEKGQYQHKNNIEDEVQQIPITTIAVRALLLQYNGCDGVDSVRHTSRKHLL